MAANARARWTFALAALVFVTALAMRIGGPAQVPSIDDAYHLKRIRWSAAHFPRALMFDPDRGERGAFCPWPPPYDVTMSIVLRTFGGVNYVPPIFFAVFCAGVAIAMRRFGVLPAAVAGFTLALSPYLIGISRTAHIDHHYVEPALVLLIAAVARKEIALGIAITIALFIQPALFVAAGLAFITLLIAKRAAPLAFAIPAIAIAAYRLFQLPNYPTSPWFLGYAHAALLAGAALTLALMRYTSRALALAAGIATALAFPATATAFFAGVHFFGGDPWLSTIVEFQPMLHRSTEIGTDIANLTGGALLAFVLLRKQRTFALFAIAYLVLAITSRRFLVPGIGLFAVAGALAVAQFANRRRLALAAAAMTLLPPIAYDVYAMQHGDATDDPYRALAERMRPLPRGRVLAPWSFGHAIDVIGEKPVVIDNFGSMPDERVFTDAIGAMLLTRSDMLLAYCRRVGVRYLVLPHPAYIPATARTIGIDPELYSRTRLARRTVWSRLYRGEHIAGFTLVTNGAIQIFSVEPNM